MMIRRFGAGFVSRIRRLPDFARKWRRNWRACKGRPCWSPCTRRRHRTNFPAAFGTLRISVGRLF